MSSQDEFVQQQQMLHQQQSNLLNNMHQHVNNPNADPAEVLTTLHNILNVMDARSNSLSAHYSQASRLSSLSDAVNIVQAQNQESFNQQTAMISSMQEVVQRLCEQANVPTDHSTNGPKRVHVPHPFTPAFNGDAKVLSFRAFKAKLSVVFQRFASAFETDVQCVNYALSCMTGPPLEHFAPMFNGEVEDVEGLFENYEAFMEAIDAAYGDRLSIQEAEDKIRFLRQKGTMQEYVSEFATLQSRVRWNVPALVSQFKFGLSEPVRALLQNQWHSLTTMKEVIEAATTAYQNLRVGGFRRPVNGQHPWQRPNQFNKTPQNHSPRTSPPAAAATPGPNDMELGAIRGPLTDQEKERRRKERLCMYCGKANHFAASCPNKRPPRVGFSGIEELN